MTPVLLSTFAALVAALPPTLDHWLAQKFKDALTLSLLTSLVGVVVGCAAAMLTQAAQGATWKDALTLALTGLVSGVGTAVVNYLKFSASGTSSGGGSVSPPGASPTTFAAPAILPTALPMQLASHRRILPRVAVAFASIAALASLSGCAAFAASKLPSDLEATGACVASDLVKGVYSPVQIAVDCGASEEQTVFDAIALLLDSAEFTAANPKAVAAIKPALEAHRAAAASK